MNKWIETYMEEKNLKPNELFRLDSQTFKGEYYFDEYGTLYRQKGNGYETPSMEIWGRLMNGIKIEKVKPKGRYIPNIGDYYHYIDQYGRVLCETYKDERDEYFVKHNLVFRTKEEAEDYKWFLDQVNKYKKEFVEGEVNHYFYYNFINKRIGISWDDDIKESKFYFGNEDNIEFRNIVGDERIKKYMFNIWE